MTLSCHAVTPAVTPLGHMGYVATYVSNTHIPCPTKSSNKGRRPPLTGRKTEEQHNRKVHDDHTHD